MNDGNFPTLRPHLGRGNREQKRAQQHRRPTARAVRAGLALGHPQPGQLRSDHAPTPMELVPPGDSPAREVQDPTLGSTDSEARLKDALELLRKAEQCRRMAATPTTGGHLANRVLLVLADQFEREAEQLRAQPETD